MHLTTLSFPQIRLSRRDGHKLRGYFAGLFGAESDLFHNHGPDGKSIRRYPLIQYKILRGMPVLLGLEAGGRLLAARFLKIRQIEIDGISFPVLQKNMESEDYSVGVEDTLRQYRFLNPWMPLNEENYSKYESADSAGKKRLLESILNRNIQAFLTAAGHFEKERIMVSLDVREKRVQFKNQPMRGFEGRFVSNVFLPDFVGLGKSVARGFGAIELVR
ncbi:MAG: DNA repair protein [Bacteroidetes bacterium]|nr:MAG: DNA repair protein [Bacteroidota bacterium]